MQDTASLLEQRWQHHIFHGGGGGGRSSEVAGHPPPPHATCGTLSLYRAPGSRKVQVFYGSLPCTHTKKATLISPDYWYCTCGMYTLVQGATYGLCNGLPTDRCTCRKRPWLPLQTLRFQCNENDSLAPS